MFSTPCRQAIYAENYQDANAINKRIMGKGLSAQSFGICSKIKEVDAFLISNPTWKNRLLESHPEFGFTVLNGDTPVLAKKREQPGKDTRKKLLLPYLPNLERTLADATKSKSITAGMDDILDALCLAVIGKLGMEHGFCTLPDAPPTDSKGIKMQMVYAKMG